MSINISGNGIGENKVVFDKLLSKWEELFERKGFLEFAQEAERSSSEKEITLSGEDEEIRFYETEASKARKTDLHVAATSLVATISSLFETPDGKKLKTINANLGEAKILTAISYENDEKTLNFTFSKFADANAAVLHIEFSDSETKTDLEGHVIAMGDDGSEISLNGVLSALKKSNMGEKFLDFKEQIFECEKKLSDEKTAAREVERMEKLKPAFDSLDEI